jgi:hypothetical protein
MDIIGASHPFFRPAIRRYVVVAICAIWSSTEWYFGDAFWGIISSGLLALAAYDLLWTYDQKHGSEPVNRDAKSDAKP